MCLQLQLSSSPFPIHSTTTIPSSSSPSSSSFLMKYINRNPKELRRINPSIRNSPSSSNLEITSSSSSTTITTTGAIVVGAGLAGLSAATHLKAHNIPFILLEASDSAGGRVRTDKFDGFLLDRGFQIFITAYPEAKKILDYNSLNLRKFYAGALVRINGKFHRVADPARHFADSLLSIANPIGSFADKFRVGLSRLNAVRMSDAEIFSAPEVSILNRLQTLGFSDSMIDSFFRPFFGGIFFDRNLETSSRLFDFIFKCLALGDNTLPENGIQAIPDQLASRLPQDSIWYNSKVSEVNLEELSVRLGDGREIRSEKGLIIAVDQPESIRLLNSSPEKQTMPEIRSTVCLYFSADDHGPDHLPIKDPILILNGSSSIEDHACSDRIIVNNMFFASNVAPSYAPAGKTLVSVTLVGRYSERSEEELEAAVREELSGWFGGGVVGRWKHLRTYRIGFAQPDQRPPTEFSRDLRVSRGVYVCGDYMESATFDGALLSGRRAAQALIHEDIDGL